ncbi:Gfo/Idh/MocA family protein [Marinilactibacillus kalidii]|uniref:Gfo/Idh/MocA family protein n=1 Tax=Marinilactibacillus kalidii TaxID=2820274 RepID=UPI001ABDCD5C|nr:Gfo/Idh/MocA family oxidoreductase [Marinilactibacillus kalidii]
MRIGIIGLGDIAQKAYLPVLSEKEGIELILCTRNQNVLKKLANTYRLTEYVQTVDELIKLKVDAVFVSTTTTAHFDIAKKLLEQGIHVYIDKPISMDFNETKQIVQLAEEKKLVAMVGFNRRFAPMIAALKDQGKADLILIQKNRYNLPGDKRQVVVEDFIHVVDTMRFLMGDKATELQVRYLEKEGQLHNVMIQLASDDCTAIGIMNRDNGTTEEIIEYMTAGNKLVVSNFVETTQFQHDTETVKGFGDWEPTLMKRGFYQMVDHFISCVQEHKMPNPSISDSLITHQICEEIHTQITGI